MPELLQCYNTGCGQKYDPELNNDDSCQYHSGEPIFHDAKKKWSCCQKYSTSFSEFLSIRGCTKGRHSNVRRAEPEKPKVCGSNSLPTASPPPVSTPVPPPVTASQPRPTATEPMLKLNVEITPSLKNMLDKMSLEKNTSDTGGNLANKDEEAALISPGTSCKNSGCKATYSGTAADSELCLYHPGIPIFHEGMKFWTCCNRKTSEFEAFMDQMGCATGRHNWTEKAARATNLAVSIASQSACRHDWFQLPGQVTLTIYAKAVRPDSVQITANQVRLSVSFEFGPNQPERYDKTFELFGIIDPAGCTVKLMGTKVEILLKKAEAMSWPRLEHITPPTSAPTGDELAS
ncbi:hypothetical protein AHF37_05132 [Paragonimus kellicotti]|nr:hypothetical protein AHF37_05132 [Paragonimus kellicotti]